MWYLLHFPTPTSAILVLLYCGYYSIQIFESNCSGVDIIVFKYCINLRSLRIFSNHQHRIFLSCELSTSAFLALIWFRLWCWPANEKFYVLLQNHQHQDFLQIVLFFCHYSGFLALLWCGLWWWIVEDSPDQDRSITDAELEYLQVGDLREAVKNVLTDFAR